MAFEIKDLQSITNNKNNAEGTGTPSMFAYYNRAGDTVTTAGYVPSDVAVKPNDQVLVTNADGLGNTWYKAVDNAGVLTLTAHA